MYTLGAAGRPNQMQARFVSRFVSHLFRPLFVLVCPRQQQARIDAAMRARSWPLACRRDYCYGLWTAWVAIITPSGPPTGYNPHARGRSSAARGLLEPRRGLS